VQPLEPVGGADPNPVFLGEGVVLSGGRKAGLETAECLGTW